MRQIAWGTRGCDIADPGSQPGSLFARHPFLITVGASVLDVAAIALYLSHAADELVETLALENAVVYSQAITEFRTVYTSEVVERLRGRGIEATHDYAQREHAIPLPATLSIILGERIGENTSGAKVRLYSAFPFPWRAADNETIFQDPFSRDAWEYLVLHPESAFVRFEDVDGRRVLRYAKADRMRPDCVDCHNSHPASPRRDWKTGDVRGVLEVKLPLTTAVEAANNAMRSVVILVSMVGGLGLLGVWLFVGRIRREEAKLGRALLADNAQVMLAYVDKERRLRFSNKTFRDWLGAGEPWLEERTVAEVLGEDLYARMRPDLERALEGETLSVESRVPFQDDTLRDVLTTYTPDLDTANCVRGVAVAVTDTTHVKGLEQYLDGMFADMPIGVGILEGPEFRFFKVNEAMAEIHGRSGEEHLGKPLLEVLPDEGKKLIPILKPILETGEPVIGREFSVGSVRDGNVRHLVDYLFPIMGADAKPKAVGAVVVDVTDRTELEEKLRRAQKIDSFGTLAGGIAHAFNNTLMTIMCHASFLRETMGAHEDLEGIEGATQHATELTGQLLTLSHKEHAKPQTIDVNKTIVSMGKMLRRVVESNIELTLVPSREPCHIRIGVGQLDQVLMNLALNGRDAMRDGGKLTLRAEPANRDGVAFVSVSVVDMGIGMSAEEREKMFDPFFTTKTAGRGSGLGLSICYGIVDKSGGEIEVKSEVGLGTRIQVFFPLVAPERSVVVPEPAAEMVVDGTETILFVEDEPSVRTLGARVLRMHGYTVLEADNGEEALSVLEGAKAPIDMIVTDMVMPRMGGRELVERVRVLYPGVEMLCTSGYAKRRDLEAPAVADLPFLQKPYRTHVLLQEVRRILDAKES